ncbi:MAG: hypothetical protein AB9866_11495 [Syntrophobacteraceae bacterium]
MKSSYESRRERMLRRLKKVIINNSYPRIQMIIILTATGAAGFLFSMISLQLGLDRIWLRYLLAICFAYVMFLLLVRIWVAYHRRELNAEFDFPNVSGIGSSSRGSTPTVTGQGGTFGGGGASGSFEGPAEAPALIMVSEAAQPASTGSSASLPDLDADLDGSIVVVIVIAAVASALVASTYLIFVAPELLAELLSNGALGTGLYMRLRNVEPQNWLQIVVRKTWFVALVVMVFFVAAGMAMHSYMPEARSFGDIWRQYKQQPYKQ